MFLTVLKSVCHALLFAFGGHTSQVSIIEREAKTSLISHFLEEISNLEVSQVYKGLLELLKSSRKWEIKEVWASLLNKLTAEHI